MNEFNVTPDLTLLAPEPEHAEALYHVICANRVHLSPWLPWVPFVKSQADTATFLRESQAKNTAGQGVIRLIAVKKQVVGVVSLQDFNDVNHFAELGYWIDVAASGQGDVTLSSRALIDYGFSACGLNKIIVSCAVHNQRSRRVIERLGFTREGLLRQNERIGDQYHDAFTYALLHSEWQDMAPSEDHH